MHNTTTTHPARRTFLSRFNRSPRKTTRSTHTTANRSGHNNYNTTHTTGQRSSHNNNYNNNTHTTGHNTVARVPAARRTNNPTLHAHKAVVKRKTTLGDKFSGAMMRIKGSLTHRPGLKIAGERRMHGTDGRTTRHY